MTPILQIESLSKRFGGLTATDDVTLDVREGEVHALIGPNGAGKSTLINQLCGELAADAGTIRLGGIDITHRSEPERVALGLRRTFQVTSLLEDFTVRQNVAMAVQGHAGGHTRVFDRLAGRVDVWREGERLLAGTTLADRAEVPVADLSHGEKKQLELVMTLAGTPRLLLLDEPMAGLGQAESREMVDRLRTLAGGLTMLLVEHDMDAVFALADRISVLVYGKVLTTGTAEEVQNDPRVLEAYLGTEDA